MLRPVRKGRQTVAKAEEGEVMGFQGRTKRLKEYREKNQDFDGRKG